MPYNELRKDYLLNRWVVIATERSRRPTDFAKPKPETAKTAVCPMCVGNENMTPPALMLYLKENGDSQAKPRPIDWRAPKKLACPRYPKPLPSLQPTQTARRRKTNYEKRISCGMQLVITKLLLNRQTMTKTQPTPSCPSLNWS